jgi:monoamine oxidase
MTDKFDVLIVGGGAAGIAAARQLTAQGRSVLIVEALPRLGGRAHTKELAGMPLDLGCGWFHSAERNPLANIARAQGLTLDQRESAWSRQLGNIDFSVAEQREAWAAFELFEERLRTAPPISDRASDAFPLTERWRPFADGLSSFMNGTELDQLSGTDFLAYEDASSDANWRIASGYGAFIAGLANSLPVALSTKVHSISWDKEVVIDTDKGTLRSDAVIITASTTVLARGDIRFTDRIDDHLHAAAQLPLGLADKVLLSMKRPQAVPAESHLLGHTDRAATGSYYMRPLGRPVIECFLGGAWARELELRGADAATAFALEELTHLLGRDFTRDLSPLAVTQWANEPTIGGSYSHALPGQSKARSVLAHPVNERVCFAGEACSAHDFSTAHGAWQSGMVSANHTETFLSGRGKVVS